MINIMKDILRKNLQLKIKGARFFSGSLLSDISITQLKVQELHRDLYAVLENVDTFGLCLHWFLCSLLHLCLFHFLLSLGRFDKDFFIL